MTKEELNHAFKYSEGGREACIRIAEAYATSFAIEELEKLWQRVPPVLSWDSEEALRASWLKSLIQEAIAALKEDHGSF